MSFLYVGIFFPFSFSFSFPYTVYTHNSPSLKENILKKRNITGNIYLFSLFSFLVFCRALDVVERRFPFRFFTVQFSCYRPCIHIIRCAPNYTFFSRLLWYFIYTLYTVSRPFSLILSPFVCTQTWRPAL